MAKFEIIASVLIRCRNDEDESGGSSKEYSATITFSDNTSLSAYSKDWYHALRLVNELADRSGVLRKEEK